MAKHHIPTDVIASGERASFLRQHPARQRLHHELHVRDAYRQANPRSNWYAEPKPGRHSVSRLTA